VKKLRERKNGRLSLLFVFKKFSLGEKGKKTFSPFFLKNCNFDGFRKKRKKEKFGESVLGRI